MIEAVRERESAYDINPYDTNFRVYLSNKFLTSELRSNYGIHNKCYEYISYEIRSTYDASTYHMNLGVTMALILNYMSTYTMNLGVPMIIMIHII